jgi:signal transduction histidine kinase
MVEGHSPNAVLFRPCNEALKPNGWQTRGVVAVTALAGLAVTVLLATVEVTARSPSVTGMRTALETSLVLTFALVAILAWGRYSLQHRAVDLALFGVVTFVWVLQPAWQALGHALSDQNGGVWAPTFARLAGALALALVTSWPYWWRHPRGSARPRSFTHWQLWGAAAAVLLAAVGAVIGLTVALGDVSAAPAAAPLTDGFGRWPARESLELLTAFGFLAAAWAFAWRADAAKDCFIAWVGVACALDSIVYVNYALFPSLSMPLLYRGDYFRVAALCAWAMAGYQEISRYQAEIARMARVEERRRIARDLHDGLAQDLAYLSSRAKLLMSSAKPDEASLSDLATTSERALQESRRAVLSLTRQCSGPLDKDLANTARQAARSYATQVRVSVDPGVPVGPDRREALVSIVREAVYNASRHGCAATATVEVLRSKGGMVLRVSDDGNGFDPSTVPRVGFGLVSMEERSRAAGGRFALTSAPGAGTIVEVEWP